MVERAQPTLVIKRTILMVIAWEGRSHPNPHEDTHRTVDSPAAGSVLSPTTNPVHRCESGLLPFSWKDPETGKNRKEEKAS